ncbi:MAG: hypothetical protein AAF513_05405 [Pseudomonadota bacterium]
MSQLFHVINTRSFGAVLALCAILCPTLISADWEIQAGVFRENPDAAFVQALERLGEVRQYKNDGVTTLRLGGFVTHAAAKSRLADVERLAADAYITRQGLTNSAPDQRSTPTHWSTLAGLTAEERAKVVLLDGEYHHKEGSTFTPLAEYLQQNP